MRHQIQVRLGIKINRVVGSGHRMVCNIKMIDNEGSEIWILPLCPRPSICDGMGFFAPNHGGQKMPTGYVDFVLEEFI